MGIKKVTKNFLVRGFNVKKWLDVKGLKQSTKVIAGMYADFSPKKSSVAKQKLSFAQTAKKFKLTEQDLQNKRKSHQRLSLFCLLLSMLVLAYTVYLSAQSSYLSIAACIVLFFLLLTYAYDASFKSYQIKKRSLDCSFWQWFASTFKKGQ